MKNLGWGFADQLVSGRPLAPRTNVKFSGKGWTQTLFLIPLVAGFFMVVVRLVWLTVVFGGTYARMALENRIRPVEVLGARGVIFDRNGEMLAWNEPVYKIKEGEEVLDINREEALMLLASGREANLIEDTLRVYKYGPATSHVLGYLGLSSPEEVEKGTVKSGIWVGRIGLEKQYDQFLRGESGARLLEVDTNGVVIRELGKKQAKAGGSLTLSLDGALQQAAYEAMGGRPGAIIVSNPETGEVLALVSSPGFDPAVFLQSSETLEKLYARDDKPLFARVVSGLYPPGSTYKIVSAAAGLESKVISAGFRYEDKGFVVAGGRTFNNWYFTQYGGVEGTVDVVRALARSTDTFFYRTGELLGADRLVTFSRKFGLGEKTGIDIGGEAEGLVPDPAWKMKVKKESWFLGDTLIMAIGQGNLLSTPVQVQRMTSVVASGGRLCSLKLAGRKEVNCPETGLLETTLSLIREGMLAACREGGTAFPLFNFPDKNHPITVACKTGTAEYGDPKNRTHAWLTAFVEKETAGKAGRAPVAVTVLVEGGGEGSRDAAPIARKVLAFYFGVDDTYQYDLVYGKGE